METNYFKDCKTEQETKNAFRHLSKILHPDLGGTCELFRDLETQYRETLKSLNGSYNSASDEKEGKRQYFYNEKIEQDLINVLKALQGLMLPDTVDICLQGTWIWVKGTVKNNFGHYPLNARHVPQLERLGLKLHSMKGECYYRDPNNKCFNKGKSMSFDRINKKYHGVKFSNQGADQLN